MSCYDVPVSLLLSLIVIHRPGYFGGFSAKKATNFSVTTIFILTK